MNRKKTILIFTSALILSALFSLEAVGVPSPNGKALRTGTEQSGSGPTSAFQFRGGPSASQLKQARNMGFYGQAAPARYIHGQGMNLLPPAPGSSAPAPGGSLQRIHQTPGGALPNSPGNAGPQYQNVDYKHYDRIILPPILDSFG